MKDYKTVLEGQIKDLPPLTAVEVKHRLKHIAGLCYGLVCDIGRMEIQTEYLEKRVQELENELASIPRSRRYTKKIYKQSEEEREKRRQALLAYWAKRREEEARTKEESATKAKGFQD